MITYEERREVARRLRKEAERSESAFRDVDFYDVESAVGLKPTSETTYTPDSVRYLADLIDPGRDENREATKMADSEPLMFLDLALMIQRDKLLALADDLDYAGANIENVAYFDQTFYESARRIREAVNSFECDSDAPMAGDDWQGGTDAHADEGEAADGARTPSIEVLRWVKDNGGIDAVKKRLIPEGMEWPTVDGKPVDFVTGYEPSLGVLEAVSIYSNGACEVMSHDGIIKEVKGIHIAKPKVYDADGVEIREGDTLYYVDGREQRVNTVARLTDSGRVQFGKINEAGYVTYCEAACIPPNQLTHRAPC